MMGCDFSGYNLPSDVYADGIGAVEILGENFRIATASGGQWVRHPGHPAATAPRRLRLTGDSR
jgi:hypothetical protein